jgi:hypothetical protein
VEVIDYARRLPPIDRERFRLSGSGIDREQLFVCRRAV